MVLVDQRYQLLKMVEAPNFGFSGSKGRQANLQIRFFGYFPDEIAAGRLVGFGGVIDKRGFANFGIEANGSKCVEITGGGVFKCPDVFSFDQKLFFFLSIVNPAYLASFPFEKPGERSGEEVALQIDKRIGGTFGYKCFV